MKKFQPILIILIVSLISAWPLFRPGYIPTHDGEYSIIRIWQYAKVLSEGTFPPRWAPDINSGYGLPLFTFYYPLPYFIGSIIHFLGWSLVDSFKLTLALGFFASATFCFFWLQKLFGRTGALIGSLIFLSTPYLWVDVYVRGSAGEILAIASVMLALAGTEYNKPRVVAFAIAAIILSHNILAMLFFPTLGGYVFLRNKQMLPVFVWGLTLSAFFWVPALFERQFVLGLSNFDFRDHFVSLAQLLIPSWGTGFSRPGWPADEMSQQVGLGFLGSVVASFILLRKEKNDKMNKLVWGGLAVCVAVLFLTLESSLAFWQSIPFLRFVQYPWRFLSFLIPLGAIFAAYATIRLKKKWIMGIIVGISLLISFGYTKPVVYEPRSDEYYLLRRDFTDGTTTVGNSFSTRWASWRQERPKERVEIIIGEAVVSNVVEKATAYTFDLVAHTEASLRLNVSYYPGWQMLIDSRKVAIKEEEGMVAFQVSPGSHKVELRFRETPLRQTANIMSALSLFWLVGSAILKQIYARSYRHNATSKRA